MTAQPAAFFAARRAGCRNKQRRCGRAALPESTQMTAILQGKLLPWRAICRDRERFWINGRRDQRIVSGCGYLRLRLRLRD